jgi:alpha-L-fucosidase
MVTVVVPSADADGSFVLNPFDADVKGGIQSEGARTPNLGYWTDAKSSASWKINIAKTGTYTMEAPASAPGDNNVVSITIGDQTVKAPIKGTGSGTRYVKNSLGEIKITKAGVNTITITGVPEGWQYINLRALTFKPVN